MSKRKKSIAQQLGEAAARDIFAHGERFTKDEIIRIELKTGNRFDSSTEKGVCGMCEAALATSIAESIAKHMGQI